ncbi:E3 SUMO-protein ligase ZBED1-like, partial [Cyprinodon tularosa]|uniref:E3 SUMO-protein ligase ZBED1-like n=1 Tax=Cyprinodon tularosa TaxID=77115 RepID=UPI0018E28C9B
MMEEWGISNKVTCMVTDGAPNMVACVRELKLRHHICVAHTMNLVVKKSLDQHPVLSGIRAKAQKLVGYFRSSTTAKEKLSQVQRHLGLQELKLMQEVETRWNSTYLMLQRLMELREPVGATLAGLQTDIPILTSEEFRIVRGCLSLLNPFYYATVELSAEETVSASKVIPLLKMLEQSLQEEMAKPAPPASHEVGDHLIRQLREKLQMLQSMSILALATLLDPRFKVIGFFSHTKATEAIKRLTSECATMMHSTPSSDETPQASTSQDATGGSKLWHHLDASVMEARKSKNVTADVTVEVQRYLSEPNITRMENPLKYWEGKKLQYPNLYRRVRVFLCTPASSVPCERVFSKAGEVVCQKRNRLKPKTNGTKMYDSARSAAQDMKERGYTVAEPGGDAAAAGEKQRRAVGWQRVKGKERERDAAHRNPFPSQGLKPSLSLCLSRLSPAEQNYDVGDRELLAIKLALEEWRHWLEGAEHPVLVWTDHKNLAYIQSAKQANPRQSRSRLIQWMHTAKFSAHPGVSRTIALISRRFWWPTLHKDVKEYIWACSICARNKTSHQPPSGLLHPLPVPTRPWSHIAIDFVTGLPISRADEREISVPSVNHHIRRCQSVWRDTIASLNRSPVTTKRFADSKRRPAPEYAIGQE